jgi:cell division septum initiation protein DivIVA
MKGQVRLMSATMTDPRQSSGPQLRVTRHGYDPADVHGLLASARKRLVALSDRIRRAEAANVALVTELRQWKERARVAEDDCRRLVEALAVAEATVATTVAEVQVRADHLIERARCEADHLKLRAREEADRVREEIQLEQLAHDADRWLAQERTFDLALGDEDPTSDPVFAQFMSDEIEDEPSREWVLGES